MHAQVLTFLEDLRTSEAHCGPRLSALLVEIQSFETL